MEPERVKTSRERFLITYAEHWRSSNTFLKLGTENPVGIATDYGSMPWQVIPEIVGVRNKIAHGKNELFRDERVLTVDTYDKTMGETLRANWQKYATRQKAEQAGITNDDKVVWGQRKVARLASENIGKDLYRQVHRVSFPQTDGSVIEAITVSDASHDECS